MKYETVIGIEIHCELKTKTKMFSSAPVAFGEVANTCVNEVDLGHPGTLPCVNKEAVKLAIKAATALKCEIDPLVKFDRKNYYYSDLPKGFQITQQFHPIGKGGCIHIETKDGVEKDIRINRIHMEEDTAKQFHSEAGTLIDFNRAGTPLIEIVSEPDIRNGAEVMINSRTKGLCPYVRKRFVIGSYSLFEENQEKIFRKAQKVRRLIVEELKKALAGYDIVIASASGMIAPKSEDSQDEHLSKDVLVAENYMVMGNFSGYPSMSMPTGFVEGMPIGINMTAKPFAEQTLFNIGKAIEEETGLKGNDVEVDA